MFKIQIKSKKDSRHSRGGYPDEDYYGHGYGGDYDYDPEEMAQAEPLDTCFFCGDTITNGHIAITVKDKEYTSHTSCIVTGLAMLVNGLAIGIRMLIRKLKDRKQDNLEGD